MDEKNTEQEVDILEVMYAVWRYRVLVLFLTLIFPISTFFYLNSKHFFYEKSLVKNSHQAEFVIGFIKLNGSAQAYGIIFKELLESVSLFEAVRGEIGDNELDYIKYRNRLNANLDAKGGILRVNYLESTNEKSLRSLTFIFNAILSIIERHEIEKGSYIIIDRPHSKAGYFDFSEMNNTDKRMLTKGRTILVVIMSGLAGLCMGSLLSLALNFFNKLRSSPKFKEKFSQ